MNINRYLWCTVPLFIMYNVLYSLMGYFLTGRAGTIWTVTMPWVRIDLHILLCLLYQSSSKVHADSFFMGRASPTQLLWFMKLVDHCIEIKAKFDPLNIVLLIIIFLFLSLMCMLDIFLLDFTLIKSSYKIEILISLLTRFEN